MSSGFPPSASAGGWSQSGFPPSGTKNGGGLRTEDCQWKSNRVGGAHGTGKAPFPHQQGKPVGRNLGTPSSPLPLKGTGKNAGGLHMERGRGSGFPPFPPREKKNGNGESSQNLLTPYTERYTKKKNGVNSTASKNGTHTGGQPSGRPSQESQRRHTRRRAVENPESAQAAHRQPRWQEATSGQAQGPEEEQREGAQVPWQLTHLEQMTVPAFYNSSTYINNALSTN